MQPGSHIFILVSEFVILSISASLRVIAKTVILAIALLMNIQKHFEGMVRFILEVSISLFPVRCVETTMKQGDAKIQPLSSSLQTYASQYIPDMH